MMTIIEQAITGKRNQQECEDGIEVNERFAAVIDGSTSKTPVQICEGVSNGRYCMELTKRYISGMPADISVEGFCSGVTSLIRSVYDGHGIDMDRLKHCPTERLTASAVVYSAYRRQVWLVGDCQCIVGGTFYENPKPQEETLAKQRAEYLEQAIKNGLDILSIQTEDPGRKHILKDLIASCKGQNTAYPVIDGFEIPINKVKVIDVADGGQDIVLASDGYPFLKNTLEKSEKALSEQLHNDPLCIRYFKATKGLMSGNKSFDDRAYIRFKTAD